jgi:hypothetical protein
LKEYLYYIGKIQSIIGTNIPNNIFLSLLIVLVVLIFLKNVKSNFYFISFFTLPGTFMHELMHYLLSFLLNGKPVSFTILPKKKDIHDEYGRKIGYSATLGSVGSTNIKWYNGVFIGIAPLLLYPISIYLILLLENIKNDYLFFFMIYIISNLLYSGFPSITDWKIAFKYSLWFFILLFICILLFYLYFTNLIDLKNFF